MTSPRTARHPGPAFGACSPFCLLFAALLAGCEHSTPFDTGTPDPQGPAGSGSIVRATFNPGDDRTVTWLPDGSGFIYSTEREDRADHDRCLAVIPAAGGTIMRRACNQAPGYGDSTDVWESPAVNAAGDLLYLRTVSRIGRQKRDHADIVLARVDQPASAAPVVALPYTAENGRMHSGAGEIRWASATRFLYLAQRLIFEGSTFYPDTILTGVDIVAVELGSGHPVRTLVPGTDWASSVAVGSDPDLVYYTLGGDSRVYRRSLTSGSVDVVHDFAAGGVARGIAVHGDRLVAVVGRSVLFRDEGVTGWVQRDEGGDLHLVDLAAGGSTVLAASAEVLFHRPAFSPDGQRVVVEVAPFAPVHASPQSDYTAVNHRHDLWIFIIG